MLWHPAGQGGAVSIDAKEQAWTGVGVFTGRRHGWRAQLRGWLSPHIACTPDRSQRPELYVREQPTDRDERARSLAASSNDRAPRTGTL